MNANTYFKREELMETITKGKLYNTHPQTETIKYQYSTGAIYEGQIKGGF